MGERRRVRHEREKNPQSFIVRSNEFAKSFRSFHKPPADEVRSAELQFQDRNGHAGFDDQDNESVSAHDDAEASMRSRRASAECSLAPGLRVVDVGGRVQVRQQPARHTSSARSQSLLSGTVLARSN